MGVKKKACFWSPGCSFGHSPSLQFQKTTTFMTVYNKTAGNSTIITLESIIKIDSDGKVCISVEMERNEMHSTQIYLIVIKGPFFSDQGHEECLDEAWPEHCGDDWRIGYAGWRRRSFYRYRELISGHINVTQLYALLYSVSWRLHVTRDHLSHHVTIWVGISEPWLVNQNHEWSKEHGFHYYSQQCMCWC